jgi:hypothetical protein
MGDIFNKNNSVNNGAVSNAIQTIASNPYIAPNYSPLSNNGNMANLINNAQDVVYHQPDSSATQYYNYNPTGSTATSSSDNNFTNNKGGQVYYDPQKGQYYTQESSPNFFGFMNGRSNGSGVSGNRNYIGDSLNKSSASSADATIKLPVAGAADQVPTINQLFPLMGLLASMPQVAGNTAFNVNDSSGAGRFLGNGSLLSSPSYANYQANNNAHANTT